MSYKSFGSLPGGNNNPSPYIQSQQYQQQAPQQQQYQQQTPQHPPQQQQTVRIYTPKSEEEKNHIISNNSHVVVDISANWCKPCHHIKPIFAELSLAYPTIIFLQEDIDETNEWSHPEQISGVPVFHFYHKGKYIPSLKMTGAVTSELKDKISKFSSM